MQRVKVGERKDRKIGDRKMGSGDKSDKTAEYESLNTGGNSTGGENANCGMKRGDRPAARR
jgi:hypothetical protein